MDIAGGIVAFVMIWWVVFFAVLPFGVSPHKTPGVGHADGAPERPRLLRKAVITTGITVVLWLVVDSVIRAGWIRLGGDIY